MESSEAVRSALLTFYERITAGDVAHFDDTVSTHPATMMCGTAPGEVVRERERQTATWDGRSTSPCSASPTGAACGSE